jgi:citrate lyase subunit beta/citryl-CoA lyase
VKPYRSILISSGGDREAIERAVASEADALVFDLEDLVLEQHKPEARKIVAETVRNLRDDGDERPLLVRVNDLDSGHAGRDLEGVIQPGLDGIMLTKTRNRDDIVAFDALAGEYERRAGVEAGRLEFLIPGETAEALEKCFEIVSHPRVFSMIGASTHGDVQHVLGYEWTAEGDETLYYRSRVLLASRAAGIEHPTTGCFETEGDIDGLIVDARCARRLGYRGYLTPFASHTGHINRVFTPSDDEITRLQAMIDGYEAALAEGLSSYTFEGRFTDLAHVKSAREQLAFASSVGALVPS